MNHQNESSPVVETEWHWSSSLEVKREDGDSPRLKISIRTGQNLVAVVCRTRPARDGTYDTGGYEELYLEFAGTPRLHEALRARHVLAKAVYQYGSSELIYQSDVFQGEMTVNRWEAGKSIAAASHLRFSEPAFDRIHTGSVQVDLEF